MPTVYRLLIWAILLKTFSRSAVQVPWGFVRGYSVSQYAGHGRCGIIESGRVSRGRDGGEGRFAF